MRCVYVDGYVLLPFLDDVVEHLHHRDRLLLGETLIAQALDEFERVKVVVSSPGPSYVECPRQCWLVLL